MDPDYGSDDDGFSSGSASTPAQRGLGRGGLAGDLGDDDSDEFDIDGDGGDDGDGDVAQDLHRQEQQHGMMSGRASVLGGAGGRGRHDDHDSEHNDGRRDATGQHHRRRHRGRHDDDDDDDDDADDDNDDDDEEDEEPDDSGSDSDGDEQIEHHGSRSRRAPGVYQPEAYAHLKVSKEVRELFQYILRYEPEPVDLATPLVPFIPDYVPAVGEIDSFTKVPRPDGEPEFLGLSVLDEPCSNQSDPTVLDLQLRSVTKQKVQPMTVRSIDAAAKNPKAIKAWINNIKELHRTKPPTEVHYSRAMPDIDSLMQVWPSEFEDFLSTARLPSPDLDMSDAAYAELLCAILDIPISSNIIESLHVLFTLYSEFQANQHFASEPSTSARVLSTPQGANAA